MQFSHQKLQGLDADRVLGVVGPVLRAHGVVGVSAIWQRDHRGWVLSLTVERPGSTAPGAGVTLDLCGSVSRDLSAAFDVADLFPSPYRLEVGSPGVERPLYSAADYERFRGKVARLKLTEPIEGQFVLRGSLGDLEGDGVLVTTDWGEKLVPLRTVESARLVFDFGTSNSSSRGRRSRTKQRSARRARPASARGSR